MSDEVHIDKEGVWRVCRVMNGGCEQCPPSEERCGETYVRACYHHATEVINVVETGNPWRKGIGVKEPWTTKP